MLKRWYFTFGSGQRPYGIGHYHVIEAESFGKAREIMFERFGKKWAFQYDSAAKAGVEEFNLREVVWPLKEDVNIFEVI